MGRLYEINNRIMQALENLDGDENGEIFNFEKTCAELEELQIEKKEILQYLAKEYLNRKSDLEDLKAEITRLEARKKKQESRLENLLYVLVRETDGQKTDLGVATIYPRVSSSVGLNDDAIPFLKEKFPTAVRIEVTEKVDKKIVKELIEKGEQLTGCWIEKNTTYSVR